MNNYNSPPRRDGIPI